MDKTFTVSYGYKTFDDKIGAGVFEVDADDMEIVQERAFHMVLQSIERNHEECDITPVHNFINLNVTVTEKK